MEQQAQSSLGERVFWRHMRVLRMPLMGRVVLRRLPMLEFVQRRWALSSMLPNIWSAPIYAGWPFEYGRSAAHQNRSQPLSISPAQVMASAPAATPTEAHATAARAVEASIVHASRSNPSGANPSGNDHATTGREPSPQLTPLPPAAPNVNIAPEAEHSRAVGNVSTAADSRPTYMQRAIRQSRRATAATSRTEAMPTSMLDTVVPLPSQSRGRESETGAARSSQREPSATGEEPHAATSWVELTYKRNPPVDRDESLLAHGDRALISSPLAASGAASVPAAGAGSVSASRTQRAIKSETEQQTALPATLIPPLSAAPVISVDASTTARALPRAPNPETATPARHDAPLLPHVIPAHSAFASSASALPSSAHRFSSSPTQGPPEMQHLVVAPHTDTSQSPAAPLIAPKEFFAQTSSQSPNDANSAPPQPPMGPPEPVAPGSELTAATQVVSASTIKSSAAPAPVLPVVLRSPESPHVPFAQPHIAPISTALPAPTDSLQTSSRGTALPASPLMASSGLLATRPNPLDSPMARPEMQHLVVAPNTDTRQSPSAPLTALPESLAQTSSQSPTLPVIEPVRPPESAAPVSALTAAARVVSASPIQSPAAPPPVVPVFLRSLESSHGPVATSHSTPISTAPPQAPTGSLEIGSQRNALPARRVIPHSASDPRVASLPTTHSQRILRSPSSAVPANSVEEAISPALVHSQHTAPLANPANSSASGATALRGSRLETTAGAMSEAAGDAPRHRNHRDNSLATRLSAAQQPEDPAASALAYSAPAQRAVMTTIHSPGTSRPANFAVPAISDAAGTSSALVHLQPSPFAAVRMHQPLDGHILPPFAPHSAHGNTYSSTGDTVSRAGFVQHIPFAAEHTRSQPQRSLPSMTSAALAVESSGPSPLSMREPDVRVLADKVYQMLIMRLNRERDRRGGANGIS